MDNNMIYNVLLDLAREYSNYVFTALLFTCECGTDANTQRVIEEWQALRNTIVTELSVDKPKA